MYFWCFYTDQDGNELIIRLLVLQRMEMALSNVLLVFLWMVLGIINDLLVLLMNGGDEGGDGGGDINNVLLVFLMMKVAIHLMYCWCF